MSAASQIATLRWMASLGIALALVPLGALACGRYGPPIRPVASTSANLDPEQARQQAAEAQARARTEARERAYEPLPNIFDTLTADPAADSGARSQSDAGQPQHEEEAPPHE